MISRALLRLLREVGSDVTTDKRRLSAYVLNQISLAVATAERSIQEPGDLTHFRAEASWHPLSRSIRLRTRCRPAIPVTSRRVVCETAPRDLGSGLYAGTAVRVTSSLPAVSMSPIRLWRGCRGRRSGAS